MLTSVMSLLRAVFIVERDMAAGIQRRFEIQSDLAEDKQLSPRRSWLLPPLKSSLSSANRLQLATAGNERSQPPREVLECS